MMNIISGKNLIKSWPMAMFVLVLWILPGISFTQADMPSAEETKPIVDNVWLKDGSTLSGTILKWELARGMEFKLMTGALVIIPKNDIDRVYQGVPFSVDDPIYFGRHRGARPYAFKETGLYNTLSVFLNFSEMGGAGITYSMGHKFSRLLGVGVGIGFETHDFDRYRNFIPLFVEARGYFLPKKITPYYALKVGYGFALNNVPEGEIGSKGGLHFSPEIGVRFGGKNVNYYLGIEYKIQNARFTTLMRPWEGFGQFTDKVSYRRLEFRTGILF